MGAHDCVDEAQAKAVPRLRAAGVEAGEAAEDMLMLGQRNPWTVFAHQQDCIAARLLDMLPAVVTATGGTLPILMDGGVRQGSDIVKALALGAKAVLVGRPQFHALAAAGIAGAAHMLHLLRTELELAMIQTGVQNVRFLCNDHVGRRLTRDIVNF